MSDLEPTPEAVAVGRAAVELMTLLFINDGGVPAKDFMEVKAKSQDTTDRRTAIDDGTPQGDFDTLWINKQVEERLVQLRKERSEGVQE